MIASSSPPVQRMFCEEGQIDFGGVRRVELPLPFPPASVNVYLVPQEDGWILVDCGINVPCARSAYEGAGIQWSDIRQTLLTHVHPDHSGLAARIREASGAPVRMHPREQQVLDDVREPEPWIAWQDCILREAGVPSAERSRIRGATRELRAFYPAVAADSYIEDGDVIPTALGPMQALLSPGHSPGHLCFYLPDQKILLAGDQLLKPRAPHVEWYPRGRALDAFRDSLEAIGRLDVEWVLPSHGRPYRGHIERIESLREHSRSMDDAIGNMVARGVDSPHDLANTFWKRPLSPFEHRNAVFEMLAYLQPLD